MMLMLWATTSWSSRAIRSRSSVTARLASSSRAASSSPGHVAIEFEDLVYQQIKTAGTPTSQEGEAPIGLEAGLAQPRLDGEELGRVLQLRELDLCLDTGEAQLLAGEGGALRSRARRPGGRRPGGRGRLQRGQRRFDPQHRKRGLHTEHR
jgi:hypothetical protein